MRRVITLLSCLLALTGSVSAQGPEAQESKRLSRLTEAAENGEFARAKEIALDLLDSPLEPAEHVRVLSDLGAVNYELGEFDRAVENLSEALELFSGSDAERAALLNDLGESERAAGDRARARRSLEEGLALAKRAAPASEVHARILNNVAGLYRDQGDFARAESLLREALEITESLDGAEGDRLATAHLNLAEVLRFQARFEEAEPHYAKALQIARESYPPDHPYLVFFLNQFAVLLSEEGELARAQTLRDEALGIVQPQADSYPVLLAMLLADGGADLLRQSQPEEAVKRYEQVLELRRGIYEPSHSEIGVALAQLARAEFAAGANPITVEARATAALQILRATNVAFDSRAEAFFLRGQAQRRLGDRNAARGDFESALELVEDLRGTRGGGDVSRARFLGAHAEYYDEAVDLALEERQFAAAFDFMERFRARSLAERLALDREQLLASVEPSLREALRTRVESASAQLVTVQDALAILAYDASLSGEERRSESQALEAKLATASRELSAAQEALRSASPAWNALIRQRPKASLDQLQSSLSEGERVLVYWAGPAHGWLLEIPPQDRPPRAHRLRVGEDEARVLGIAAGTLGQESLSAVLQQSQQGFAAGPLFEPTRGIEGVVNLPDGSVDERLHALWKILIPVDSWKRIQAADEITILPTGALHLLPFEALVTSPPAKALRYWLDDGPPVRYADSATTLLQIAASTHDEASYPTPDVLSVNNPDIATGGLWPKLPPLPGTEEESRRLLEALGSSRVELLTGDEATESALRVEAREKRYLHLAMHGVVDENRSELLAALALARDEHADGRLQLFEIDELELSAQLAVLSACRTAAGRRLESEGVFALSRGFHIAGASRVIASLWSVSDASTAELVAELFRNIARLEADGDDIAYSVALRDAKRAIRAREEWAQPFYWAPFILSGIR